MPQMTKLSASVLKHFLALEVETAAVNKKLLSGRPEIDFL
jgi:hypothetical protein